MSAERPTVEELEAKLNAAEARSAHTYGDLVAVAKLREALEAARPAGVFGSRHHQLGSQHHWWAPHRQREPGEWDGKPAPGATLLVRFVGGYGDMISWGCMHLPATAARVGHLAVRVPEALYALCAASFGHWAEIVPADSPEPAHDVHIRSDRLPLLVGPIDAMPTLEPRLERPAGLAEGLNVGICWWASDAYRRGPNDVMSRSMPLNVLTPALLELATLHSLQRGPGEAALANFPMIQQHTLRTFADTARIAVHMDAVVSVDTSVAHLAAACGVPTLLLLTGPPLAAQWWSEGWRTPWYRSMWLLRQSRLGDWSGPVACAGQLIRARDLPPRLGAAARARSISAGTSTCSEGSVGTVSR